VTRSKLVIEMEIEGDPQDAFDVVNAMLDNGDPQDTINNHENEEAGPLHVVSAVVKILESEVGL
jgi:hypothetical protein